MLLSSSWAISITALVFSFSTRANFSSFEYLCFFVSTIFLIYSCLVHKSKNRKAIYYHKIEKFQLCFIIFLIQKITVPCISYSIRNYNPMTWEIQKKEVRNKFRKNIKRIILLLSTLI